MKRNIFPTPVARRAALILAVIATIFASNVTAAQRVVSVDGAVTEIIYSLEAESVLVGVDTTSTFPEAAKTLPKVGYRRTLTSEGILSLAPDRVIAGHDAGPASTLQQLQAGGIRVDVLPGMDSVDDVGERILQVARWLNADARGQALHAQFTAAMQAVQERREGMNTGKVLFLLAAGPHGMMIGGKETQAQLVLDALGMENAAADTKGYKPFGQESALTLAPDAIIVAETQPGAFRLAQWPALQATPAAQNRKIVVMDSMFLLGFGPRLPQALARIQQSLGDVSTTGPERAP